MKDYHSFGKTFIGGSDIASLTVRSVYDVYDLHFGQDGMCQAYVVDGETEIPKHYHLEFEGKHWVWIFNDDGKAFDRKADIIRIYRAGEMGCIIQLINNKEEQSWKKKSM